ncbi:MAG: GntR family transcriptional regulator [Acidobacteria bacterium]|nr:GntR family transcriptional regulator [Acidobacteriota bacterium]
MTAATDRPLLRDTVCDKIRQQIIEGTHPAGGRLVEDRLADELGVSRNPVREALRVLEAEGFVEMKPRRGAFVARLSEKDVSDIFDVRAALEAVVARTAARNATEREIAKIEQLLESANRAVARADLRRVAVLNRRFHEAMLDLADNVYLRDVLLPLRGRMQKLFQETASARAAESLEEHRRLLVAVAAHDEKAAGALAVAHVEAVRTSLSGGPAR